MCDGNVRLSPGSYFMRINVDNACKCRWPLLQPEGVVVKCGERGQCRLWEGMYKIGGGEECACRQAEENMRLQKAVERKDRRA